MDKTVKYSHNISVTAAALHTVNTLCLSVRSRYALKNTCEVAGTHGSGVRRNSAFSTGKEVLENVTDRTLLRKGQKASRKW